MASTSSTPPQRKYDVFLSFRGLDTRNGFVSHLFKALSEKQIITFKDENLDRGEQISDTLSQTIKESYVSVVIFSKNYACSAWCLDELVTILQCNKEMGQVVLPVFYEIDPTEVQELTGSYGNALMNHRKEFENCLVESWSHALMEIAAMAGFVSWNTKPESKLIDEIANRTWEKLNQAFPYDYCDDGLVGINSCIKDIEQMLCLESKDVRILGIWGMGGIGKTTLARKIFERISSKFHSLCFVANVREKLEKSTLDFLQHEIISKLLGKEYSDHGMSIKISSSFIIKWIMRKKIFIVLDDVNDSEQINFLIGTRDIYSPGSRIIITSRDKQILKNGDADIYEVKKLNYHNAFQLFILHAFKGNPPAEALMEVARVAVEYGRGIPLALKVLGSNLYNKNIEEWKDHLKKLEGISDKKIRNVLKISFDDLDKDEKEIFLDIACFFKSEEKDKVENILSSFGHSAIIGIRSLLDKSLITISNNKICMHDLLQQMGRDIVLQEGVKNPEKRSRLWIPQDIYHVLTKDLGKSISIESISLDMSKGRDMELNCTAFERMNKLKFLKFYSPYYEQLQAEIDPPCKIFNISLSKNFSFLPDELRYLYWHKYPLKSLPLSFCPDNLVQLHLICSHVQQLCNRDQEDWDECYTSVFDYYAGFRVDGGELPQKMRYQNNCGSSLQFSLRPDPCDFMILAFCAVVAFKEYHSRELLFLECKCRFTAESGVSLCFQSYYHLNPTDHVLGSEHNFFWFSTVNLFNSKYSFNKASFEFYPIFFHEGRRCVNSSAVVIKCGVHVLYDNNDINLPSFMHRETPSVSSFPHGRFGFSRQEITQIMEDEVEEEEEQVNC
ncbi:conserved hypothetical protein [Ricinus communis]|uniref:TIR domain-containing protein n=1 Tax=Ricinus communis TaxID=3988 RepID=B9S9D9_RICCO|nr:conserved hypothetical protein [Ricinus communis]